MMVLLKHRRPLIAVLALGVLLLWGCSGSARTSADGEDRIDAPAWYRTPPADSTHLTVTDRATSQRKTVAIDRAVTSARSELAVTLQKIVDRARRGGGIPSSLEAKLEASSAVQIPVDSLLVDVEATPVSQSGCGGATMCKEFSTAEELQRDARSGESTGDSPLRAATTRRTEARQAEDGTWHGFALVALPVEAVATALRQAAADE
jgi:hypothetical protein